MNNKSLNNSFFSIEEVLSYIAVISKTMYDLKIKYKICHRDIKPENILIKNGIVKIADLATGKVITNSDYGILTISGSPAYMSPKMLDG